MRLKSTGLSNEKVAELTGIGGWDHCENGKNYFSFYSQRKSWLRYLFWVPTECIPNQIQRYFTALKRRLFEALHERPFLHQRLPWIYSGCPLVPGFPLCLFRDS
jgi:hypothetical protein